jgi:hypothetical protein
MDELRRAAETLRSPYRCNTTGFELALADWLDEVAERVNPRMPYATRSHGWTGVQHARKVARLINGDSE